MKINKQEILRVLGIVKPALASKEIVEQTTHFGFTGDDVVAYNDFLCIVHPFKTDFVCSVPAAELYKILDKVVGDEVEFTHKENKLTLKAGKTRGGISTQNGKALFDRVEKTGLYDIKKYATLPKDLMEALGLCMFSASADHSDKVFGGVCVDNEIVKSADSMRMSQYYLEKGMGKKVKFNVPLAAAQEVSRIADFVAYHVTDNMVFFKTEDDIVFCVQLIDAAKFPSLDDYFEFEGITIKLPEEFTRAVDTALIMATGDTDAEKLVDVEIAKDGNITCRGENDLGWIETETESQLKVDKPISFSINPFFLLKILGHTQTMVYGADRAMFFSKKFNHLIALKPNAGK